MRAQRKGYWCGVASIANALEVLGIRRAQREIAKLCHVTPSAGTNEVEMMRALLANGVAVDEYSGDWGKDAYYWVLDSLDKGWPCVLCVDNDEHWVTAIGKCGEHSVLVFDPSRNSGIEVHDTTTLPIRWGNEDGIYYGLAITHRSTSTEPTTNE